MLSAIAAIVCIYTRTQVTKKRIKYLRFFSEICNLVKLKIDGETDIFCFLKNVLAKTNKC